MIVSGDANVGAGHHWSRPLNCYTLADILSPITIDLFFKYAAISPSIRLLG